MPKTDADSTGFGRARFEAFKILFHVMPIGLMGLAFFPAVSLVYWAWHLFPDGAAWKRVLAFSMALPAAYFAFGFALMALSCAFRTVLRLSIRPGIYRIFSDWQTIRWMGYNSLILVVNAVFLDAFRVSPMQNFFYRAMGAKIGSGAQINTSGLADLSMIEIGKNTIIGGGVTMICHAADRGMLKLAPVRVGDNVTIGLGTVIMPDVVIGDGAVISPRSMVPAGSRIPERGRFGGDPLIDLRSARRAGKDIENGADN